MKRKQLGYMPIDPRRCTIFLDSCAFDPKYSPEDQASRDIFQRYENNELKGLIIAHSTQKEIDHPNTPDCVKIEAKTLIYSIPTMLTDKERQQKAEILRILTGNGKPEKFYDDAMHVFEASKYVGYFITTDKGILNKKDRIENVCSATVLKPSELLEILAIYSNS